MRYLSLVLCIVLVGCSNEPKVDRYVDEQGIEHERVYQPHGGIMDTVVSSAVAGASAGAAGAVAHRLTSHAIEKHRERRTIRRSSRGGRK